MQDVRIILACSGDFRTKYPFDKFGKITLEEAQAIAQGEAEGWES